MSKNECCSSEERGCNVKVNVDVNKIVKSLSIAAVLIVGIIFGTMTFRKMLEQGFFDIEE